MTDETMQETVEQTVPDEVLDQAEPNELVDQVDEGLEAPESEPSVSEQKDEEPEWFKKRFDKITAQKYEAQQKAEAAERKAQELAEQLERYKNPAPVAPDINAYDSLDEYHKANQDYVKALVESNKPQPAPSQPDEGLAQKAQPLIDKGRKTLPDFDKVMSEAVINQTMADVIVESERGHEIAYHLGQNKVLGMEISMMTPTQAAMALGKLEATLAPHKPKSTQAKPPPKPNTGGGSAKTVDPSSMSPKEYRDWRFGLKK